MQKIFVSREAVKSAFVRNAFLFALVLLHIPWCNLDINSYEPAAAAIFQVIFIILFYNKGNLYLVKIFAAIILSEQADSGIQKIIGENAYTEWLSSLALLPKESALRPYIILL